MNKPMDEKDKRFRDAQQGQESKEGRQQRSEGTGSKPPQGHQPGRGEGAGQQGGGSGFKKQ